MTIIKDHQSRPYILQDIDEEYTHLLSVADGAAIKISNDHFEASGFLA